ncbi:hypothetical protein LOZ58_002506 [Ophidiomyces ophidiicola]|nr:hypothetical protein LOZ58_002506 [Ophidiomyces ophidiicola]
MPGRQSHVLNNQKTDGLKNKATRRKRKLGRGLDALTVAEREYPQKSGIKKHRLGEDEEQESGLKREFGQGTDDEDAPSKRRRTAHSALDEDGGSDSDGNEWKLGKVDSDEDSDIDSDNAFGSSDEERFEGFTFRASSSKTNANTRRKKRDEGLSEDENDYGSNDEIDDDLGNDAVDLAAAWDMNAEESEEEKSKAASKAGRQAAEQEERDEDESASETGSEDESDKESQLSFSDNDDATESLGLSKLQRFVTALKPESMGESRSDNGPSMTLQGNEPTEFGVVSRQKLTVADLLPTLSDSRMKGSLKHLHTESVPKNTQSSGIPGKLDVPLSKREQDRLDRAAAYQKSKETLDRWIDTVKDNRRAEHLTFPLPEIAPVQDRKIAESKPRTDLETTIQNILVESGLASSNGKDGENRIQEVEELQANKLSIEEIQARRIELRKARELLFREEVRAKRIKKIKSKAYRRVHRKERERMELREREALAAAGVEMDEDDREKADRLRAEMRMGAKHRESKWAKSVKESGRAAWDDDARAGMAEQARRKDELQRRIEGKRVENEEYLDSSSSESEEDDIDPFDELGSENESQRLKEKLKKLGATADEEDSNGPHAKLFSMRFMQNAEASRKAANDAEIRKLSRQLDGNASAPEEGDEEAGGRQHYGKKEMKPSKPVPSVLKHDFEEPDSEIEQLERLTVGRSIENLINSKTDKTQKRRLQNSVPYEGSPHGSNANYKEPIDNPWLSEGTKLPRKMKRVGDGNTDVTLIDNSGRCTGAPRPKHAFRDGGSHVPNIQNGDDTSDEDVSGGTVLLRNEELVQRAFAGDEVLEAFKQEKRDVVEDEGDQVIEDTLPGWGAWTGSGLSKREQRDARAKRSFTTKEGISPERRKDSKLERVIINEKRIRKNTKYLASQLPHPFESRQQYERSLRLPIGPEWTTKEVFQSRTKPRVMVKQGVIKPIQRPHM